ncbi:hypothetical protein KGM_208277B, partial [Danaus plexippus plexippus]
WEKRLAVIGENMEYRFIPTNRGKHLLMLKGYTYSQMKSNNNYYCSKRRTGNCKARVKLNDEGVVICADLNHTHTKPHYVHLLGSCGRYCYCNARVKLNADGSIESASDKHNHPPPKYVVDSNGMYLKVCS